MSYKIANWEALYETHETRKLINLRWVPIPNRHDGAGFRRIAARKDACEIFTAWILLLQIASKSAKRGNLPDSPDDAGYKTGFPASIFHKAYNILSTPDIGWLEIYGENAKTGESPGIAGELPGRREGNRREGNRDKASHPFFASPFYDITVLGAELKGWSKEKIAYYWETAKNGSEAKGYKYINWAAAIRNWAKRDEKDDRAFKDPTTTPRRSEAMF